jgi:hypothetical protein
MTDPALPDELFGETVLPSRDVMFPGETVLPSREMIAPGDTVLPSRDVIVPAETVLPSREVIVLDEPCVTTLCAMALVHRANAANVTRCFI